MDAASLITDSASEFAAVLPDGGVLLALDLGTKTIGTALCDAGWRFATAQKTLERGKFGRDRDLLSALVRARSINGIVIGLPRNMDGSYGMQADITREFADAVLANWDGEHAYQDERLTTASARRMLIEADMRRDKRKQVIDKVAAVLILQSYLDAHGNT